MPAQARSVIVRAKLSIRGDIMNRRHDSLSARPLTSQLASFAASGPERFLIRKAVAHGVARSQFRLASALMDGLETQRNEADGLVGMQSDRK